MGSKSREATRMTSGRTRNIGLSSLGPVEHLTFKGQLWSGIQTITPCDDFRSRDGLPLLPPVCGGKRDPSMGEPRFT